jgi:hypothetical protein
VAANPKWKRLSTSESASAELKRDAEEFYPRLAGLAPAVRAIDRLARRAAPADRAGAETVLEEIRALLALGRESDCVRARLPRLTALAQNLLARVAGALELAELVHAQVDTADDGAPRLTYDFASEPQALDWRRDDGYLASLRGALPPVSAGEAPAELPTGKDGFRASGEFCWRHALEFRAPLRVRYQVRWEPGAGKASKAFAFALGMLADPGERHVRMAELGFLYVDEQDGQYTAVRPSGNPIVQAGHLYALELAHDGTRAVGSINGEPRVEAEAPGRKAGHVFLWSHSDLAISIPSLVIEGHPTPESLAGRRAEWARAGLERLGLAER